MDRIEDLERSVATAELVERGSSRLLDRVEGDLERNRAALRGERQQKNRLLVGMGALQRENEGLRARVMELEAGHMVAPALPGRGASHRRRKEQRAGSRPGFWAGLLASFKRHS